MPTPPDPLNDLPVWRSRAWLNWLIAGGTFRRLYKIARWRCRRTYRGHFTNRVRSRLGWMSWPGGVKDKNLWEKNKSITGEVSVILRVHQRSWWKIVGIAVKIANILLHHLHMGKALWCLTGHTHLMHWSVTHQCQSSSASSQRGGSQPSWPHAS